VPDLRVRDRDGSHGDREGRRRHRSGGRMVARAASEGRAERLQAAVLVVLLRMVDGMPRDVMRRVMLDREALAPGPPNSLGLRRGRTRGLHRARTRAGDAGRRSGRKTERAECRHHCKGGQSHLRPPMPPHCSGVQHTARDPVNGRQVMKTPKLVISGARRHGAVRIRTDSAEPYDSLWTR